MSHAPRPRDIYPSLYGSKRFRRLDRCGQLLFVWMIVMGDDEGRGDLDLDTIAGDITPADPMTDDELQSALRMIDQSEIAKVYQVDGEWYYQIRKPLSKVRPDRFKASTYPSADCGESRRFAALFSPSSSPSPSPSLSTSLNTPARRISRRSAADRGEAPELQLEEPGGDARPEADRDQEFLELASAELRAFIARAEEGGNERRAVAAYLRFAVQAIDSHYAHAGGSFTARRKLNWLRRMSSYDPYACLIAMEIYVDLESPVRDYRFLCGIAKRLTGLDHKKLDEEANRHRLRMSKGGAGGLFVTVSDWLQRGANGPQSDQDAPEGAGVLLPPSESP